jgi:hypothetical protein
MTSTFLVLKNYEEMELLYPFVYSLYFVLMFEK